MSAEEETTLEKRPGLVPVRDLVQMGEMRVLWG